MAKVNQIFSTSNSTVAQLAKGATLTVVGPGQLRVDSIPAKQFVAGQRFQSKYGYATIVAPSSRFGELEGFDPETQVLYIADGTFKVRIADKSSI